jgi:hypothetical protein
MANYCEYMMKITGRKEDVNELIEMMQWKGRYEDNGLGRIYDCWAEDAEEFDDTFVSVYVNGNCAWSVLTAMRDYNGRYPSLESETKRLCLVVEVYSSEPGMCFQEHCIIDKGEVVLDDCLDYEEHYIGDFDTIEEYNEEYGTDFTEDMIEDEEYIYVGGFGDEYGRFKKIWIENFR